MAEARQNPTKQAETQTEPAENGKSAAKGKAPALYHVYTTEDEAKTLVWVKDVTAKTAEAAISMVVRDDQKLVGKTLVAAPQRNLKTFSTEVKTTTRVKVSAA